jgi:hypothetical protein
MLSRKVDICTKVDKVHLRYANKMRECGHSLAADVKVNFIAKLLIKATDCN